jgi:uncharacterized DUF497 family protein
MIITWDETKRRRTLEDRGLDFADAALVFAGHALEFEDDRADYGEPRMVTVGRLAGRMVIVVWTPRGAERRIVSMRKANDRENARYGQRLG